MVQLSVHKISVVADEKERAAVLAVIDARRVYYEKLFGGDNATVDIRIRYEGAYPLRIQIQFVPVGAPPVVINVSSYKDAVSATKYALMKLRRVARHYFIKSRRRKNARNYK